MKGSFQDFWKEHAKWSQEVFGSDQERGPIGPAKHLAKEVQEFLDSLGTGTWTDPLNKGEEILEELADCQFLLFDITRRSGFSFKQLLKACWKKLEKNKKREWSKLVDNEPVEHIRNENQSRSISENSNEE